MDAQEKWYIHKNRQDYQVFYDQLTFIDRQTLSDSMIIRDELLSALDGAVEWGYHHTKADCSGLSPGCRHCGSGTWSCLFINGVCNANCFYCPTPQDQEDQPTTQTVTFTDVEDYMLYLKRFGYKGVSISGGEPLLTFEKTLHFITRIREEMGSDIYFWMYTNGILLDEEKLKALRHAGLDELRLDIGATGYRTHKAEMALQWIDRVTVEIPAVPEELDRLKQLLHHFDAIGLSHLNLHQIRCTPHNYKKLVERGYTFLHGPQITVMESELTALRLMQYAAERGLQTPVNYCSSIYKYRYQRRAARKRYAPFIAHPYEEITETGMIRSLAVEGDVYSLERIMHDFEQNAIDPGDYYRPEKSAKIYFRKNLWNRIDFTNLELKVSYARSFLLPRLSYRNMFKEVELRPGKSVVIERAPVFKDYSLRGEEIQWFEKAFISKTLTMEELEKLCGVRDVSEPRQLNGFSGEMIARLYECEQLGRGLPGYF
mgnify:CR=1 FL=1